MRLALPTTLSILCLLLALPTQAQEAQDEETDIVEVIRNSEELEYTAHLFDTSGFDAELEDGEYTIFVPSERAWGDLDEDLRERLLDPEHRDDLRDLLAHHVVEGTYNSDDLMAIGEARAPEPRLATMNGDDLPITAAQDGLHVHNAVIIQPDMQVSNGIIHVVDTVLLPPSMQSPSMGN